MHQETRTSLTQMMSQIFLRSFQHVLTYHNIHLPQLPRLLVLNSNLTLQTPHPALHPLQTPNATVHPNLIPQTPYVFLHQHLPLRSSYLMINYILINRTQSLCKNWPMLKATILTIPNSTPKCHYCTDKEDLQAPQYTMNCQDAAVSYVFLKPMNVWLSVHVLIIHLAAVRNPELDEKALKYGNACNGVLRAAACSYQEQLLRRDCITGKRLFPFVEDY